MLNKSEIWNFYHQQFASRKFWNGITFNEFEKERLLFKRSTSIPKQKKIGLIEKDPKKFLFKLFSIWEQDSTPVVLTHLATQNERYQYFETAPYHFVWDHELLEVSERQLIFHPKECLILFTSGSTGGPKGVVFSWENLASSAISTLSFYRNFMKEGCRWQLNLPLNHIGGFMIPMRSMINGSQVSTDDGNIISLVPTQLRRLLKSNSLKELRSYDLILLGGSSVDCETLKLIQKYQLPVSLTYGQSETTAQIAASIPGDVISKSGVALPQHEIKIIDGVIAIKSPSISLGHYIHGRFRAHELKEDYFLSDDWGQLDSQGRLEVLGRKDRVFISGGENIGIAEVEKLAVQHPSIIEAMLIPYQDKEFGECGQLFYQTHNQEKLDSTELKEFFIKKLSPHKVPKKFLLMNHKGLKPSRNFYQNLANSI